MVVLVPAELLPVISSSTPPQTSRALQPIKLLSQREQYTTCHIQVPDEPERMAAIALNGRYYSFFRRCHQVHKALGLMMKLGGRGDAVAVTSTRRGYVLWLHEPDAIAPTTRTSTILPSLEPADCWVISDRQPQYRSCNLRVPDLPDTIPGLTDGQRCYSLYRREEDGDAALKLAARLTQRGDEVIIVVVAGQGHILCVREPSATPVA
jgi:hypothetical protein